MVHIEKFKSKGRDYYRLVHNIRIKNKIIHKTRYLGKSIPPKKDLLKLKGRFLREIKKGGTTYLSQKELEEVENKKEKYILELKKLGSVEKAKKLEEFMIRYTYDSSKLSGVDITLRQTFLILKDSIIPKEFKSLRIAREVENHERGFMMITKYRGVFNLGFVKKLHKIIMKGVSDEIAGKLRSELRRNVQIAGTPYIPPKWDRLEKEIENFFSWYKENNRKLHPLELASLIHLKLISMQIFSDGNSRLSRLLMNWVLWKKGYPMIDIPVEDLENYYNALDYYRIGGHETPFVKYILKKYLD